MKKITLSVALFLTTVIAVSATNLEVNNAALNTVDTDIIITNGTKVYQWYVKTSSGVYAGTASTLEQANNKIAKAATGTKIISQGVQAISLKQNVKASKIYTWATSSNYGFATGTSASFAEAESMLKLITSGDVTEGKIIESYKLVK
jgi:hypothetical protein